jgi:NADH:ubiquinone oxidoreductase subunit 4 (subunit M)
MIIGFVLAVVYVMILYNRVVYGSIKVQYINNNFSDLIKIEFLIFFILLVILLLLGLFPNFFLLPIDNCVNVLCSNFSYCKQFV